MMVDKNQNIDAAEAELDQVLRNFRQNVHAWSDAQYGRPRAASSVPAHHTWRIAAAWALGGVLAVGGLSAGFYEHHHQKELATSNSVHQEHQQQMAAITNQTPVKEEQVASMSSDEPDAGLLAGVDSDVSRQVPSAMEPLAQLMEDNSSK